MRPLGVVRKLDTLGRIVLPVEVRRRFKVDAGAPVHISVDGEAIVLMRHVPRCIFCLVGSDDIEQFRGKPICAECKEQVILRNL